MKANNSPMKSPLENKSLHLLSIHEKESKYWNLFNTTSHLFLHLLNILEVKTTYQMQKFYSNKCCKKVFTKTISFYHQNIIHLDLHFLNSLDDFHLIWLGMLQKRQPSCPNNMSKQFSFLIINFSYYSNVPSFPQLLKSGSECCGIGL